MRSRLVLVAFALSVAGCGDDPVEVRVVDWDRALVSRGCEQEGPGTVRATDPDGCFLRVRPGSLAGRPREATVDGDRVVLRFPAEAARRWRSLEHVGVIADGVLLDVVHPRDDGALVVRADDPDGLADGL